MGISDKTLESLPGIETSRSLVSPILSYGDKTLESLPGIETRPPADDPDAEPRRQNP